jgi:hypothetical protein
LVARVRPGGDTTFQRLYAEHEISRRIQRRYNAPVRPEAVRNEIDYRDPTDEPSTERDDFPGIYKDAEAAAPFRREVSRTMGSPSDLDRACADGLLTAYGRYDGGRQEPVPPIEFANGAPAEHWTHIVYDRAKLRRVFPSVPAAMPPGAAPDEPGAEAELAAAREWMRDNFKKGDTRNRAIKTCMDATGCRWCDALAAYVDDVPKQLKRTRGQRVRTAQV